jgi:FixJ family two-component response regulator
MENPIVVVFSDDSKVLETTGQALGSLHHKVNCFIRPDKCLERLSCANCNSLIIDLTVSGIDGIDLVGQIISIKPWIPTIGIVNQGDISAAVRALRAGAVDVVEKPLDEGHLKRIVESLLLKNDDTNTYVGRSLAAAEMRVLNLIIREKTNSEVAYLLGRSVRTVEWHRANIMRKLGVDSLLSLIKRAVVLGIVDLNVTGDA